jgi:hypothetical protein
METMSPAIGTAGTDRDTLIVLCPVPSQHDPSYMACRDKRDKRPKCPTMSHVPAKGVKMGPKFKLTAHQQREAIKRRDTKGEPVREIARTFNVSHSTISRLKA